MSGGVAVVAAYAVPGVIAHGANRVFVFKQSDHTHWNSTIFTELRPSDTGPIDFGAAVDVSGAKLALTREHEPKPEPYT